MSPFSAPFFWGTQKPGLLLAKRVAALWREPDGVRADPGNRKSLPKAFRFDKQAHDICGLKALLGSWAPVSGLCLVG
jgi:hypothetical protein